MAYCSAKNNWFSFHQMSHGTHGIICFKIFRFFLFSSSDLSTAISVVNSLLYNDILTRLNIGLRLLFGVFGLPPIFFNW